MDKSAPTDRPVPLPGWRGWGRGLSRVLLIVALLAVILFASAGRLDWLAAWLLVLCYAFYLLGIFLWAARRAPGLMQERSRVAGNVKAWDKWINLVYALLLLALLIIAGLDAGRFHWSAVPLGLQVLGLMGLGAAGGMIAWTLVVNAYLSRWARIQEDRGQTVVTDGPYRYLRHPMYAAIILLMFSLALQLGSYRALIPAGLIGGVFVLRTALEDRMLQAELPGYREYASRVRYRLFPGLW
jgi:protein-S-isoprenylcysteine O-methyltransferase Ste14